MTRLWIMGSVFVLYGAITEIFFEPTRTESLIMLGIVAMFMIANEIVETFKEKMFVGIMQTAEEKDA